MIRHSIIAILSLFIISFSIFSPSVLFAEESVKYIDNRGREITTEELNKEFFPDPVNPQALTRSWVKEKNRGIKPIEPKKITVVFDLSFEKGSDNIIPKYRSNLRKMGKVIEQHPESEIYIDGHTCDLGSKEYNQILSEKRAERVRDFLIDHYNISRKRLIVTGYGETSPRHNNRTIEGRRKNRRVEFMRKLNPSN